MFSAATLRWNNDKAQMNAEMFRAASLVPYSIPAISQTLVPTVPTDLRASTADLLQMPSPSFADKAPIVKMRSSEDRKSSLISRPSINEPGISADELQLRAQGHAGELPRQFSAFATLALAFSMTNSWIGYSATFPYPLLAGGGPTVFYGLLVASVACTFITAGLAELASAFPSSGGQYHFAFMVSPPKYRASIAFTMGWLSVIAWCLTAASTAIVCAQICVDLAAFYHADFAPAQYQVWLIYVLLLVIATSIVIYLPRAIPRGEIVFFLASLIGFFVFFITVLATSSPKQKASTVFTDFNNQTGYSDGTAFMLGVGTCMYAYLATDGATHIAEELPNPGRNVPRAMWLTMVIGIVTVIPWTLAFMFSTTDLNAVVYSALPILTVYQQALSNRAGATFFTCWLLFIYFGALISCVATCGRLTWAFARDNGLPFSPIFARVHTTLRVPANATFATAVFCVLYGLIYIASTTAFNSFISMSILSLNVTYAIPQAIALLRGRDKVLPKRHFDLGPIFGPFCNAFSAAWIALYTVLFCLPPYLPVTLTSMNYVSVVVAGVVVLVLGMWFLAGKRRSFVGPQVELEGVEFISQANRAGMAGEKVDGVNDFS